VHFSFFILYYSAIISLNSLVKHDTVRTVIANLISSLEDAILA
jgi:hypothetical protein